MSDLNAKEINPYIYNLNFGIALRPEWAALLMSISSIIVATNAVLLNRAEKSLTTA